MSGVSEKQYVVIRYTEESNRVKYAKYIFQDV